MSISAFSGSNGIMYKIALNLLVLFLMDCIGSGSANADDYMKREFSLVKPYHGKSVCECVRV